MNIKLYFNTIKYLKTTQIYYRLYYALKKRFKIKKVLYIEKNSYDLALLPSIYMHKSYLGNKSFKFINITHKFDNKIDWNYSNYGKLWTYNLNYFEFLNQKYFTKNKGLELIYNYIDNLEDIKDGLEPFTISLRGLNWIKFLSYKKIKISKIDASLYAQYKILFNNLEYHLLGNHLLENAFSLMFGAYYFRDNNFYFKAKNILKKQLNEQILEDGAHFELSPMYHQLMLFRLLDIINLITLNSWKKDLEFLKFLKDKASLMVSFLEEVTFNSGEIALVNDSAINIAPSTKELIDYAKRLNIKPTKKELTCGYKMIKNRNYELFIDSCDIKATYIAGHTHSDLFNFLLNINGKEFLIDSGISTYEANDIRAYERSSKAHNCVVIDNKDIDKVWGAFRVANRAKVTKRLFKDGYILAEHNGYYKEYKTIHKREFQYDNSKIKIKDTLIGPKKEARLYLHFANDIKLNIKNNSILTDLGVEIKILSYNNFRMKNCYYSKEFNINIFSKCIEIDFKDAIELEILI